MQQNNCVWIRETCRWKFRLLHLQPVEDIRIEWLKCWNIGEIFFDIRFKYVKKTTLSYIFK